MTIHDPKIDAMFRRGNAQEQVAAVLTPLNDVQLVGWLAALLKAGNPGGEPQDYVEDALELVGEAAVQMQAGGLQKAVDQAKRRHDPPKLTS